MAEAYGFDEQSAARIGRVVRRVEGMPQGEEPLRGPGFGPRRDHIMGRLKGSVTARSSLTPGTGTLRIYNYGSSSPYTITETTEEVTVLNWVASTVGSSTTFAAATRHFYSGQWHLAGVECV